MDLEKGRFVWKKEKNDYSVYVEKYRVENGYGSYYAGRVNSCKDADKLAITRSKVGDKVVLKKDNEVIKTGVVCGSKFKNVFTGQRDKRVKWN